MLLAPITIPSEGQFNKSFVRKVSEVIVCPQEILACIIGDLDLEGAAKEMGVNEIAIKNEKANTKINFLLMIRPIVE